MTKIKKKAFEYGQVVRLLESERGLGLVVKRDKDMVGSPRAMIGFPKEALAGEGIEEWKEFLLEKCPQLNGKIKKL